MTPSNTQNPTADRIKVHRLENAVRDALCCTLTKLRLTAGADNEDFIRASWRTVVSTLPDDVLALLDMMKDSPNPPGGILIQNCPIDASLPATPHDGLFCQKTTYVAEGFLLGTARQLGHPYTYYVEKAGALVHNVVPVLGKESSLTNMGAIVDLGFHTELAFFRHRPRWLGLFCLRPDHERKAHTPISDVRDALELMSPEDVAQLRRPQFCIRIPMIFDSMVPPSRRFSKPVPVLTGPTHSPEIRAALYGAPPLTQAQTAEGQRALKILDEAVRNRAHYVRLDAGDLLLLSNYIVLHARTPFTPRWDGRDRWLIRVHIADTLWPHRCQQRDSVRVLAS